MTRYFEKFYNSDPMVEISAEDARARGTYTVEDDLPMRRYRRYIDRELHTIIYTGWGDPTEPLADFRRLASGVAGQIFSPVTWLPDGGCRWTCWFVNVDGTVKKALEPEFAADGNFVRESLRSPDGMLVTYTVYHYDRDGHLLELVTHAPDGTVLNTQDA